MTLRQPAATRPNPDPALERIQREHELHRALEAAPTLQERLELLGDRDYLVRIVRNMRDGLASDLAELAEPPVDEGPCPVCDHAGGHHDQYAHAAAAIAGDPDA